MGGKTCGKDCGDVEDGVEESPATEVEVEETVFAVGMTMPGGFVQERPPENGRDAGGNDRLLEGVDQ